MKRAQLVYLLLCIVSVTFDLKAICKMKINLHKFNKSKFKSKSFITRDFNEKKTTTNLKIEILVESLCPYSIKFINESFANFFHTPNSDKLAEVIIYPFGNGKQKFNETTGLYEFKCQHGINECYGNLIQVCAMNILKNSHDSYEFLICSYSKIKEHKKDFDKNLKFCLNELKYEEEYEEKIKECSKNKDGNRLMHLVASNYPDHKHVPWVVVNGEFDEESSNSVIENLLEYACENSDLDEEDKGKICDSVTQRKNKTKFFENAKIKTSENPFNKDDIQ